MNLGVKFGGPDTRALRFLDRLARGFYISDRLSGEANDRALKFIREQYLEKGTALFGRETPESLEEFRKAVGGDLNQTDDQEIYRIICFAVQRIRNYSHILDLGRARIYEFVRIVAIFDEKTSSGCRFLDGKYIRTKAATEAVNHLVSLTPDEYAHEYVRSDRAKAYAFDRLNYLRRQGGVGSVINDSVVLEGRGLPPFHRTCRTRVEAVVPGASIPRSGAEQAVYGRQRQTLNERGYVFLDIARIRLGDRAPASIDPVEASEIIKLIRRALEKEMSDHTKAGAQRLLGEFAEARYELKEALIHYRLALNLNPKIGLKRKIQALQAKLAS